MRRIFVNIIDEENYDFGSKHQTMKESRDAKIPFSGLRINIVPVV